MVSPTLPTARLRRYLTKQVQTSENAGFQLGELVWIVTDTSSKRLWLREDHTTRDDGPIKTLRRGRLAPRAIALRCVWSGPIHAVRHAPFITFLSAGLHADELELHASIRISPDDTPSHYDVVAPVEGPCRDS